MPINIRGKEYLPGYPRMPSLILMNHSSALDIPIVEMLVGTFPHVWMSKDLYGKVPFLGMLLRRMHVLVKRESPSDARKALLMMYNLLKEGSRHGLDDFMEIKYLCMGIDVNG